MSSKKIIPKSRSTEDRSRFTPHADGRTLSLSLSLSPWSHILMNTHTNEDSCFHHLSFSCHCSCVNLSRPMFPTHTHTHLSIKLETFVGLASTSRHFCLLHDVFKGDIYVPVKLSGPKPCGGKLRKGSLVYFVFPG